MAEHAKSKKRKRKEDKKERRKKKEHKKSKRKLSKHEKEEEDCPASNRPTSTAEDHQKENPLPLVESSALPASANPDESSDHVTLLLFYQYVEPSWSDSFYKKALLKVRKIAASNTITGRMRVAKEGLNCTLSGSADDIRNFCSGLRKWQPGAFNQTEFKLTHHLPESQRFKELKIMPVAELVHYGLEGDKAPPLNSGGTHLEPSDYHKKLAEDNTVVIDVRNHYEAAIGHFQAPGAEFVDPKMRKSTEFPVWLDDPSTKEKLKGKQVLMYCTGGIRCERASALLKYKMDNDPEVKKLGIQGVYQLQGGIDKYFKEFPDGGYWKGKNYTFDRRYAHEPVATNTLHPIGNCEACRKPWDRYRGKRRCPACGVPSLICKDCYTADQEGTKKLDKSIRCDLCVEQGVFSKRVIRDKESEALQTYEKRQLQKGLLKPCVAINASSSPPAAAKSETDNTPSDHTSDNPEGITRLYLKNMCKKNMTEEVLMEHLPGITHIVWKTRQGSFFGQGWVEMESAEAAALAVSRSGEVVMGRPLYIEYQAPDPKDVWPPPKCAVI